MPTSKLTVFHRSATGNISMMQKGLKEIKNQSPDKLILGHLIINSVRNKFESLTYIIDYNIDLLLISETKLDDSFPIALFQMKDFSARYSKKILLDRRYDKALSIYSRLVGMTI